MEKNIITKKKKNNKILFSTRFLYNQRNNKFWFLYIKKIFFSIISKIL